MKFPLFRALGLLMIALCAPAPAARAADKVNIAISNSTADFAILIAMKRGYFSEEGIEANPTVFDSGGKMMAPLGAGDIDVATGSANATLYNAVARGIGIKIVSGNGNAAPGYGHQILIVRKQLVDSGRYKTMADLKGMKIALPGAGTGATSTLNQALKTVGLAYKDIDPIYLAYPNHVTALANGAIDAGLTTEPAATYAVRQGIAARIASSDTFYPWSDATHIVFSSVFIAKKPDAGRRFMRAFMKAMRFYDGALADGVTAKDVILAIIGEIGTAGGTGHVIEYCGSAIEALSLSSMCSPSSPTSRTGPSTRR